MELTDVHKKATSNEDWPDPVGREILKAVAGIQYGSVEVLIHDARVVQIEAREKIRFPEAPGKRR